MSNPEITGILRIQVEHYRSNHSQATYWGYCEVEDFGVVTIEGISHETLVLEV